MSDAGRLNNFLTLELSLFLSAEIIKFVTKHLSQMNLTKYSFQVLIGMALFLLPLSVQSQEKDIKIPEGIKKTASVEGITEYRLKNGLKVLLFPDQSKPTTTVNITYLVGSRHEGYGETGMAHLLEHMVFQGTPNHPDIPAELTEHGASPNGTTWYDRTNYYETFKATEENLEWALDLEADRMVNSFIAKEDLESEMTVVRNEFESGENNPEGILYERVLSSVFLWHNYGKSTIGARSDIENVPIERLQAFYRKYYQPDNAVLLVAGKFDVEKTLQLVDEKFNKIPKPDRKQTPLFKTYTKDPTQDGERMVTLRRVGDVQAVSCAYHTPPGSHPDYAAIAVLDEILTNEPSGRLYKALVETQKASSLWGFAPGLKEGGYVYFSASVRKDKSLEEAKNTMLETLDGIPDNPPTEEEVERAKSRILKYWNMQFTDANRVGLQLSEYIAQGDWRLLFIFRDAIENVTIDDVLYVAKKYYKPSNRTIGLFIPEEKPDRAEIPDAPNLISLVRGYKGKKEIAQGEEFDPSPANIESRTKKVIFDDGLEIALLQKENRGDAVDARIVLRFGTLDDFKGKSEISNLTASMLMKGTANMSREEIQDKLDKLKATVNISGNLDNVTATIKTENQYLPEVMEMVAEMLKNPSFPEEEFKNLVEEQLSGIESQMSEPQAVASTLFSQLVRPYGKDDPRYTKTMEESIEAIKAVTLEDVQNFYKDFYGASDATMAVVGDFDEKAIGALAIKEFGAWKSPKKFKRIVSDYKPTKPANEKLYTPDKANAMFFAGVTIPMGQNNEDYPAMTLGNFMLGGGFLNSRLATRIRQDEGLSYGVGSFFNARAMDENAIFGAYAIYAPENVKKLEQAFKEEIIKVVEKGFTAEELEAAKTGWLQSREVGRTNDRGLASSLESNLYLDRDMMWAAELEEKVKNLTVEQVNAVMKKYLEDPEKFVYVKAGDFEKS
jgi:zinc protease